MKTQQGGIRKQTSFVRQLNSFYYLKFVDSFNCDNVCFNLFSYKIFL